MQTRLELVVRSEHDGDGTRFLDERWENSSVQTAETFAVKLDDGRLGGEAVQLLPKDHFVEGKSEANVYKGRRPS